MGYLNCFELLQHFQISLLNLRLPVNLAETMYSPYVFPLVMYSDLMMLCLVMYSDLMIR